MAGYVGIHFGYIFKYLFINIVFHRVYVQVLRFIAVLLLCKIQKHKFRFCFWSVV